MNASSELAFLKDQNRRYIAVNNVFCKTLDRTEQEVLLKELHHRVKNNMQLIASLLNIEKKQHSCKAECDALSESQRRIHSIPLGLMANEIISNAFKHAFPDGRSGSIEISAQKNSDELIFSIADTGIGMSEDIDIDSDYDGMLIIKSLVDQLAGKVRIEREQGTRFLISLPLYPIFKV